MKLKIKYLILFLLGILCSCTEEENISPFPLNDFISHGKWEGNYWPTNEWKSCSPEEVGMNSKKLEELHEEIQLLKTLHVDIHSVIIIKDGYIVAEQYFSENYNKSSLHSVFSCTKSITSAVFGLALDRGKIKDINTPMTDYFPEYEIKHLSENKKHITLEHLLTMSAGLEWYEIYYEYNNHRNTFSDFAKSPDQIQFVLNQPSIAQPGAEYNYNTGISHVLSAIVQKNTGQRVDLIAEESIFKPLGIKKFEWFTDSHDIAFGGSGVKLTPRDLARFGYLYLKEGNWDGNQIISKEWVLASTKKHIKRKYVPDFYYGYHWWVSENNYYAAVGARGQWLAIFPDKNLVVVLTNDLNHEEELQRLTPERLINTYILPAIK